MEQVEERDLEGCWEAMCSPLFVCSETGEEIGSIMGIGIKCRGYTKSEFYRLLSLRMPLVMAEAKEEIHRKFLKIVKEYEHGR